MDFFQKYSEKCNFRDPNDLKAVYLALIRLILQELRYNDSIKLPGFGEFRVHLYKERVTHNIKTRSMMHLPAKRVIKFIPDSRLKTYVRDKIK